jgi:hypothetical protein
VHECYCSFLVNRASMKSLARNHVIRFLCSPCGASIMKAGWSDLGITPIWGLRPDLDYYQTVAGLLVCGVLSDERTGLSLPLLLALASAVILGSESLGTHDHILLSQIRDFPFRRLLRLAGSRWRYSTPPPHLATRLESETVKYDHESYGTRTRK